MGLFLDAKMPYGIVTNLLAYSSLCYSQRRLFKVVLRLGAFLHLFTIHRTTDSPKCENLVISYVIPGPFQKMIPKTLDIFGISMQLF